MNYVIAKWKRARNNHGFTLMEVIVVIAILGALTALALPQFTGVLNNAQVNTDNANVRILESAVELCHAETGAFPVATTFDGLVTELASKGYLKDTTMKSASGGTFDYDGKGIVTFTPNK
ncbi:MAG: competence type IV pilus major pilin ComGC [Eubacteriaceae bacterium]